MQITSEPVRMKLHVLIPVSLPEHWRRTALERYRCFVDPRTQVEGTDLSRKQQTRADGGALTEVLLENGRQAEAQGTSACIIDCFGDPGLAELGTALKCPVVGVGHAGMHHAYGLGVPFGVVTSEQSVVGEIEANAERYGFASRLVRVGAIGISAAEVPSRRLEAVSKLREWAEELAGQCGLVVLGCTELATLGAEVEAQVSPDAGMPRWVNPIGAAVGLAQTRVLLH